MAATPELFFGLHDRLDRAFGEAGAAVNALFRVDDQEDFSLVLSRMHAIDGADGHTRGVALAEALFSDDVGHVKPPMALKRMLKEREC